jgi:hypothetical protein
MKTKFYTLLATIVLMGAVYAAAGQPARGSGNDNRAIPNEKRQNNQIGKKNNPQENIRYKGEERPVNRNLNQRAIPNQNVRRSDNRTAVSQNRINTANRETRVKKPVNNYKVHHAPARVAVPKHFSSNRYYYYTPKYGHTVRKFHSAPVVFYAKNNPYYFHNDHFYRYYRGIGYVWIENPYGMIFPRLPHGTVMVHINGRPYFRYGNVYFAAHRRGYEVISVPAKYYKARPVIHISASF